MERKDNSMKASLSLELDPLVRGKETRSVGSDKGKCCLPFLLIFLFSHSAFFFHNFFFFALFILLFASCSSSKNLVSGYQREKKVVSDSPGLVDFAIGLVNSIFKLPNGK